MTLRLIEPGKPNQNAYIESFNGRFRDENLTTDGTYLYFSWQEDLGDLWMAELAK